MSVTDTGIGTSPWAWHRHLDTTAVGLLSKQLPGDEQVSNIYRVDTVGRGRAYRPDRTEQTAPHLSMLPRTCYSLKLMNWGAWEVASELRVCIVLPEGLELDSHPHQVAHSCL